jgi:hypothetical protein
LWHRVTNFAAFSKGADPVGEHVFGALEGQTIFRKIDCYDQELRYGSPIPPTFAVDEGSPTRRAAYQSRHLGRFHVQLRWPASQIALGAWRANVTGLGTREPRVDGLALPKSVESGNLSFSKTGIRWMLAKMLQIISDALKKALHPWQTNSNQRHRLKRR